MTTNDLGPRESLIKMLISLLLTLGLAAGGLYWVKMRMGPPHPSDSAESTGPGSAKVGATIPDFELTGLQGKKTRFSDIRAKVILVNFWATWCEACMVEMPSIVQLRNTYKDKGFEVVGVNLDENPEAVLPKAIKELGISFPVFNDSENKITDFFDVHAIPLSVFLGPGRKILYIENGERNWNDQDVHRQIEQWLSGETS